MLSYWLGIAFYARRFLPGGVTTDLGRQCNKIEYDTRNLVSLSMHGV